MEGFRHLRKVCGKSALLHTLESHIPLLFLVHATQTRICSNEHISILSTDLTEPHCLTHYLTFGGKELFDNKNSVSMMCALPCGASECLNSSCTSGKTHTGTALEVCKMQQQTTQLKST